MPTRALPMWDRSTPEGRAALAPRETVTDIPPFQERVFLTLERGDVLLDRRPPPKQKGALIAIAPDSPEEADVLRFSRYPEKLEMDLQANVGSEDVAGRSLPTLQHLGAKGIDFNLELVFHDAFLDEKNYDNAGFAKSWLEVYTIGHDGTGASVPYVDTYLQLGNSPLVRVMIRSTKMTASNFNRADQPQVLEANLQLTVYEPVYLVNPFRPKSPAKTRVKRKSPKASQECASPEAVCITPGPTVNDFYENIRNAPLVGKFIDKMVRDSGVSFEELGANRSLP